MEGTRLGAYRLQSELGRGGMGTVHLAEVTRPTAGLEPGTRVAVKVIHAHLLETSGFLERFLREADIGRTLRHENVVRTYDCATEGSGANAHHFLVMEYVQGQTVRDLLLELGRIPEDLCRHIGGETAKGLAAIHDAGVVHRDLKPENILITPDHVVKIMDLGVARLMDEAVRLSQTGAFVGSLHYAAPEQFAGASAAIDGRADLHALGLVLYELATGSHPYMADSLRRIIRHVLETQPRKVGQICPQLSAFFEEIVHCLLAKAPHARIGTAHELARVLSTGESSDWWRGHERLMRTTTNRPMRRIHIPRETAVYGRERELRRLRELFECAKEGSGQVALIEGESGVGKSRLIDEWTTRLRAGGEDVNVLLGGYPPGGAGSAVGGFSSAFAEHFGEAGAGPYLEQTPTLVDAFDAILRMEGTPRDAQPLTMEALQTCFVNAMRSLAAQRVTIITIEDLHVTSEAGRALFTSLAMAVPGHRILLVGTARPGVPDAWRSTVTRLDHATWMSLPRLGAKDLIRLLEDALHSPDLAHGLSAQIALKSDGNPFFVIEIIRGLRERNQIRQRADGTWVTTGVMEEVEVPSSVLDLVNARVASLGQQDRDLLDAACCWGYEFDPSLLAEALGISRIPLLKQLAQIERAHRLVRTSGRMFVFDHHQVQEALYGSLPQMLREAYHAALAEALEARTHAAAVDPVELGGALCVDLCEHFLRGTLAARALRYLDAALEHLTSGHLHAHAMGLAKLALAPPRLLVGEARVRLLIQTFRWADLPTLASSRGSEVRAALDEALALAIRVGDAELEARAGIAMSGLHASQKEFEEAHGRLEWARERLGTVPGSRLEAQVARELGNMSFRLGHFPEARDELLRALQLTRSTEDARGEALALGSLGTVHHELGRVEEAEAHYAAGLALARTIGDQEIEGRIAGAFGNVFLRQGRLAEARIHYERLRDLAQELGIRTWEATAAGSIANATSDPAEARTCIERALSLAVEIGARDTEATARVNLAADAEGRGLYADALAGYERGQALRRDLQNRVGEHGAAVRRAALLARLGDARAASEILEESHDVLAKIGARRQEGEALSAKGAVAETEGDLKQASAFYAEAAAVFAQSAPSFLPRVHLAAGRVALDRGKLVDAGRLLADAVEGATRLNDPGVVALAQTLGARLDEATAGHALKALLEQASTLGHAERMEGYAHLYRATGDRAHAAASRCLLDQLVENAPRAYRTSMQEKVRLHRAIREAR